ncbi:MAG: MbnP family protein [Sphingobacteriales bacterium]|jgi:hypothetical protein
MMKIENRMINVSNALKMVFLLLIAIGPFISCSKEKSKENNKFPIILSVKPIALGTTIDTSIFYKNGSNELFKISKFKFYISQIELVGNGGQYTKEENSYHLIDLLDKASQTFTINMEAGSYDSIRFIIGVDSSHNVSGAQSGALDPVYGMFWTWNTGYIFIKLEGHSPSSSAPNQNITYHIGGFRTGQNAIRKVSLPGIIHVESTAEIIVDADIKYWFDGKESLRIANFPTIMTPGPVALQFADNYAKMLSLNKIISR